jgi:hypothetical protein
MFFVPPPSPSTGAAEATEAEVQGTRKYLQQLFRGEKRFRDSIMTHMHAGVSPLSLSDAVLVVRASIPSGVEWRLAHPAR